jgi:hypothetical protein
MMLSLPMPGRDLPATRATGNRCLGFTAVLIAAALLCPAPAHALINPNFTPIHLVKQSAVIFSVDLKQGESKDQYAATIREVLKGKTDLKKLSLDLSKAINPQNADALRDLTADGKPALFFVGEFAEEQGAGGGGPPKTRGFLHLAGQWAEFDGQQGAWAFSQIDSKSQAVWAGGTDMLHRAVRYIIEDDDPEMPVADGAAWSSDQKKIAKLGGKIKAVRPIDLAGDGKQVLFVARDQGDCLLACNPKTRAFTDVTAARGLESKSLAFAWGDFDGDGRLDLVSFDGKALSLHAQQSDGTLKAKALALAGALENGCLGLAALDCGTKGESGLLVTTSALPVLVTFEAGAKPSFAALTAAGVDTKKFGKPGPSLVADFNGDELPDILMPFAAGSILFRAQALGKFAPGEACAVKLGAGDSAACVADFDADGRFDVFCVSTDGVRIWQNDGEAKFAETLHVSGEIAYISKPGGIDCMVGDVNNDGRQDALIAYGSMGPQLFFNRGFRSFGHAHTLDLAERQLLQAAEQGQQSACLGDFDGDGAQDMVLALGSGEIWVFYRENDDREARCASAVLPVAGVFKGPATVAGWIGKRGLGAWNVVPGTSQAFFGRRDAGPVTVKWRLPGGKPQQKEVVVEKETVRVEVK